MGVHLDPSSEVNTHVVYWWAGQSSDLRPFELLPGGGIDKGSCRWRRAGGSWAHSASTEVAVMMVTFPCTATQRGRTYKNPQCGHRARNHANSAAG